MAKDIIHNAVKNALVKDCWTITHEQYTIFYEGERVYSDLAAERMLVAEKGIEKIIVEVKSFIGLSIIQDFKIAIGQYTMYYDILDESSSEYQLYIAISDIAYKNIMNRKIAQLVLRRHHIPFIIVDIEKEMIIQWIK
ncbi:MAG: hypothetical protein B6242_01710 [Anaerolineaceae bacterium 4572_78]|nr:MAG: hypothetical protein B6242_01710 [Anaerolineaceae bacterium 4572_78]